MARLKKERTLFMLGYWTACLILLVMTDNLLNFGFGRNLFLAFLPLFFIEKAQMSQEKTKIRLWVFLWFIFFPNSIYPITSFIHISTEPYYWVEGDWPMLDVVYTMDIYEWLQLFLIGIGFLYSVMVGYQSLFIFERKIRENYSTKEGYIAVFAVTALSGLAVFWGRFLRLNSWDIFIRPWELLSEIVTADHLFALQFTIAFTLFALAGYYLFRLFGRMARQQ